MTGLIVAGCVAVIAVVVVMQQRHLIALEHVQLHQDARLCQVERADRQVDAEIIRAARLPVPVPSGLAGC